MCEHTRGSAITRKEQLDRDKKMRAQSADRLFFLTTIVCADCKRCIRFLFSRIKIHHRGDFEALAVNF